MTVKVTLIVEQAEEEPAQATADLIRVVLDSETRLEILTCKGEPNG